MVPGPPARIFLGTPASTRRLITGKLSSGSTGRNSNGVHYDYHPLDRTAGFVDNLELAVAMITDVVNGTFKVRQLSRGIALHLVHGTVMIYLGTRTMTTSTAMVAYLRHSVACPLDLPDTLCAWGLVIATHA